MKELTTSYITEAINVFNDIHKNKLTVEESFIYNKWQQVSSGVFEKNVAEKRIKLYQKRNCFYMSRYQPYIMNDQWTLNKETIPDYAREWSGAFNEFCSLLESLGFHCHKIEEFIPSDDRFQMLKTGLFQRNGLWIALHQDENFEDVPVIRFGFGFCNEMPELEYVFNIS